MQYVLSAKELTELAKEVAAATAGWSLRDSPSGDKQRQSAKEVLAERGIAWWDDE